MAGAGRTRQDLVTLRSSRRLFWLCLPLPFLAAAFVASRAQGGSWSPFTAAMVDLQAIVAASERLLAGELLYGSTGGAPYSMPPLVAALAVPLAVAGTDAAQLLWMLLSAYLVCFALVGPILSRVRTRAGPSPTGPSPAWVPLSGALLIALAAPVKDSIALGQLTVVVACLLLADVGLPHSALRLPRGVLTGIAAAVAIFPAVVIVLQLLTNRSRRAGLVALTTGSALTLLAWLLAPTSSVQFFSATLTGRHLAEDNALERSTNGSIAAVVSRSLTADTAATTGTATVLTVVISVLIIAASVLAGLALAAKAQHALAVLTAALGGIVTMPLAFPHAWVLAIVLAGYVLVGHYRQSWKVSAAVLGLWVAVMPPNRVGSELVAAGTALLVIGWLIVVLASARRESVRAT